ncbi:uncharacterized protein CFAP97D1 [Alligator sinensis]|uniref:Uncharacterized protein CFAP97D1 n=1 Tax=Alligator sinensis TaxID=38654 RepID=A0A3Q0GDK9_ALLSI|nr:uncharacterized protein CFAP97D1 [Alligator sinensis]
MGSVAYPVIVANYRQSPTRKKKVDTDHNSRNKQPPAPHVDNKPPKVQIHHHFKVSRIQEDQKRIASIERENKKLLEKLAEIYRGKGIVDCWNEYRQKSSNREKQNREIVKITLENQRILKKLGNLKATYDHRKYEIDWQENMPYMEIQWRLSTSCPVKDVCNNWLKFSWNFRINWSIE